MKEQEKKLFCFGYGYTCDYLGYVLQQLGGWHIVGTTRDPDKKSDLVRRGIEAHIFDYDQPLTDPSAVLGGVTHLLISTPPDDEGDPSFLIHAQDILNTQTIEWVGYLSTTNVYGDRNGGDVTEMSEIRPSSKRGTRRSRAENQWLSLFEQYQLPVHVFRLAGIYGPGRSALDSVRAGVARRINKPGHAFNRIHVEDIVQILLASMKDSSPGSAYNLADDNPAPSHEVIAYACELLGLESPPLISYEQADMAPIAQSFYKDNKRVRNDKIKNDLNIQLKFSDYKSGLDACYEAERYAMEEMKKD